MKKQNQRGDNIKFKRQYICGACTKIIVIEISQILVFINNFVSDMLPEAVKRSIMEVLVPLLKQTIYYNSNIDNLWPISFLPVFSQNFYTKIWRQHINYSVKVNHGIISWF